MPRVQVGVATSAALNKFRSSTESNQVKVNKVDANVDALANAFNDLLNNYGNTITQVGHNENRLAGIPNTTTVISMFNADRSRIAQNENRLAGIPNATTVISMFNADRSRIAQNEKLLFGLDNVSGTVNTRMTALEQIASVAWTSNNHGAGSGLDADKLDGVEAVGFVRYHTNALLDNSATVDALISQLSTKYGAFNDTAVTVKVSWNDGANSVLDTLDSECGLISLSGCVIETWGSSHTPMDSPVHIRITRPVPGVGGNKICVYNKQTEATASGWRNISLKDTWREISSTMGHNSNIVSASTALVKKVYDNTMGALETEVQTIDAAYSSILEKVNLNEIRKYKFTAVEGQTEFDCVDSNIKPEVVQVFIEGIFTADDYTIDTTKIILPPQSKFTHITILN